MVSIHDMSYGSAQLKVLYDSSHLTSFASLVMPSFRLQFRYSPEHVQS